MIAEVANALGDSPIRVIATRFLRRIASDPGFRIITNSDALYDRGMELYEQRPDKAWSLTDCISFIVMQDEGTREALTADHHFKQAGFVPLFEQRP